ncbi:13818_t:CDS:2, partial [Cetraspora pellucida]
MHIDALNDITNLISNDDENNELLQLFKQYKSVLHDALKIMQEQENANNIQWAQAVQRSFKSVQDLVIDVKSYKRRINNPYTWKDHNKHT